MDRKRLAAHETLEIHELLAFTSVGLAKHKRTVRKIRDPQLQALYMECIATGEQNVSELAGFLQGQLMVREEGEPS